MLFNLVHCGSEPGWLLAWRPLRGGEVAGDPQQKRFHQNLVGFCWVFFLKCEVRGGVPILQFALILRLAANLPMGDCRAASPSPWAGCLVPSCSASGFVGATAGAAPGRGEAVPRHPGGSAVCTWSFSPERSLAGEVELY